MHNVLLISGPCAFAVVSRSHDGRLAEANRFAAANGALEAAARAHHAAQHPGVAGSDDKEPAEYVGATVVDVPAISRAAQRAARAVAHASAAGHINRHHRQQTHQLHRQCTWSGDYRYRHIWMRLRETLAVFFTILQYHALFSPH